MLIDRSLSMIRKELGSLHYRSHNPARGTHVKPNEQSRKADGKTHPECMKQFEELERRDFYSRTKKAGRLESVLSFVMVLIILFLIVMTWVF